MMDVGGVYEVTWHRMAACVGDRSPHFLAPGSRSGDERSKSKLLTFYLNKAGAKMVGA